jgi:hypothetical protein
MFFIVSLLPATIFAVIGYFVVFASTRSEGGVKRFGQYLGGWVLFLAGVTVLGGALAPIFGIRGFMDGVAQHMETMSNVEEQQSEMLRELQRD